jgi:transmembrane protein 216|eukprot:TRINITY_DN1788_c1_g1_i1.p2 TRINITY_DN1788_c1_g1~~TRINITY_DN1788_c1_g1_i1.p2  ORF type:complete len:146 (+),score=44.11 TRINITY_DN1788_c1_g1_i1:150-587(+)
MAGAAVNKTLSSLPLQVLVYFNEWFNYIFVIATLLLMVYKRVEFPYPGSLWGREFSYIFLFALIEWPRLFLASRGNKTEQGGVLAASLLLTLPSGAFALYFIRWQTYVLRIDVVLNGFLFTFMGLEFILAIFAILTFKKNASRGF